MDHSFGHVMSDASIISSRKIYPSIEVKCTLGIDKWDYATFSLGEWAFCRLWCSFSVCRICGVPFISSLKPRFWVGIVLYPVSFRPHLHDHFKRIWKMRHVGHIQEYCTRDQLDLSTSCTPNLEGNWNNHLVFWVFCFAVSWFSNVPHAPTWMRDYIIIHIV